jgi:hypothetical protein
MLSVEAIAISTQQVSRQLSTTCTFVFIRKRSIPMNQPPPVALSPFGAYGTTFPRCIGRATKGKRLYGQARRLTSPDLHILCRMCTVDNNPCLI